MKEMFCAPRGNRWAVFVWNVHNLGLLSHTPNDFHHKLLTY